jgi:hypothetical protein
MLMLDKQVPADDAVIDAVIDSAVGWHRDLRDSNSAM